MRRLVTLDFLRGFAIWMMVIFHTFQNSWSNVKKINEASYFLSLPYYYLVPLVLIGYLSSWAGLFIMISTSVNVMATHRRIEEGIPLFKMRDKQLLTGVLLLILGYFTETFAAYTGFAGYSYHDKDISRYGLIRGFFDWRTLQIIGLSLIISSLLIYYLYRDDGHLNIRKNLLITGSLALLVIMLTPVIEALITSNIYSWWSLPDPTQQYEWPQTVSAFVLRFTLVPLNGHLEPLFPFLATAFIGMMFGMILSQDQPPQQFPLFAMITGFFLMGIAVMMFVFGTAMDRPFAFHRNIAWYLMGLGGQILGLSLVLWLVEFKGNTVWFKEKTVMWRRWGMSALSIYCWQIMDIPIRTVFHLITGLDSHIYGGLTFLQTSVLALLTLIWFDLLLRLWSRYDFKFSYEWLIINLTSRSSQIQSERTQVEKVVYDVEPIDFSQTVSKTE